MYFIPELLAVYEYSLSMAYDFRKVQAKIKGVGGRAIVTIDSPLKFVDFGTCRLNRVFKKSITLTNSGNLGINYHLRPEGASKDWDTNMDVNLPGTPNTILNDTSDLVEDEDLSLVKSASETKILPWVSDLEELGFRLVNPDGFSKPHSKTPLLIEYTPKTSFH